MFQSIIKKIPKGITSDSNLQSEEYDPFKRPPDLTLAKKHALASRFAMADETSSEKKDFCPCCGLPIVSKLLFLLFIPTKQNNELDLCCSRSDFNFNGPGIALYFEFFVFVICMMSIFIIVSGIYNLVRNSLGDRCDYENYFISTNKYICNTNYYNVFSLSNRTSNPDVISSALNLLSTFFIMFLTIYYRKFMKLTAVEIDNASISVSDYSIQIKNLPLDSTEEEIKEFFSKQLPGVNQKIELRKICLGYNISPYTKLLEQQIQKENLLGQILSKFFRHLLILYRIDQGQKLDKIKQDLELELKNLQKQIEHYESNIQKSFQFSGVAFLTYNKQIQADIVRRYYRISKLESLLIEFQKLFQVEGKKKFRGKVVQISRAPEPGDIQWENLGIDPMIKMGYKLLTNIASIFVLGICFGIILGISAGQQVVNDNNQGTTSSATALAITILGVISSFAIAIINQILAYVIRKFAQIERPRTSTEYNQIVAKKLGIAQFLNTAIITLITNFALGKGNTALQQLWMNGGLNSDVSLILIMNGIFPILITLGDPFFLWRMFKRKRIEKLGQKSFITQKEANSVFEGPQADLSKRYAQTVKTLMLSFFYAYLLPLGIPIQIISLIVLYWIEKIFLIRRDSRPPPIGFQLAEEMVDFFIEFVIVIFASGCCIWETVIYNQVHVITWIQLAIALLYYIIPMEYLFYDYLEVEEAETMQTYDEKKNSLWDEYDRRNPVTMEKALEDWVNEETGNNINKKYFILSLMLHQVI